MKKTRREILLDAAKMSAAVAAARGGLLPGLLWSQQQQQNQSQPAPPQPPGNMQRAMHSSPRATTTTSQTPTASKSIRPPLHPDSLAKFVDPLPIPPVAKPLVGTQKLTSYRMTMRETQVRVHRDLKPTRMWCYGDGSHWSTPGPTIEARRGHPVRVEWRNSLPLKHFLPIDHTIHGAGANVPEVRTVVHVHGARVPAESDGYPEVWYGPGHGRVGTYPLQQDAATLWYHDHTMGIERLNQYAGLFGFFLVRDEFEDALDLPKGEYEIPLAICDRIFFADGQLHYPDSGDPAAPWIPEVFGDTILVNGKLFPYLEVEARPYRFRLLNASNTRSYHLSLSSGQSWHQIGADQGLLPALAELKDLGISPAERADVVLDFSGRAGQQITLQEKAWEIMQFRVKGAAAPTSAKTNSRPVPATLRPIERIPEAASIKTRTMTLNEYMDPKSHRMLMLLNGTYWHQPVTEKPALDSVEIWELMNLTEDIHPIHLHMVRFQVLDRHTFDVDSYLAYGKFNYVGKVQQPAPNETGWKDTVQAYPEMVTRIIVRWDGYPGRYVWHCHLLEHAANEMMRPLEVVRG